MRQLIVFTISLFTATNANAQCSVDIGVNDAPWCSECGGSAWVTAPGATPPVTFLWSNGATTPIIQNLCPGDYSIEITDAEGCVASNTCTINANTSVAPLTIELSTELFDPNYSNYCISVNVNGGGCPPFLYSWSPNDQFSPSPCTANPNTEYFLTISDACGCQSSDSITTGDSQVNLELIEIFDVSLYPNPNNGEPLFISGL